LKFGKNEIESFSAVQCSDKEQAYSHVSKFRNVARCSAQ